MEKVEWKTSRERRELIVGGDTDVWRQRFKGKKKIG